MQMDKKHSEEVPGMETWDLPVGFVLVTSCQVNETKRCELVRRDLHTEPQKVPGPSWRWDKGVSNHRTSKGMWSH